MPSFGFKRPGFWALLGLVGACSQPSTFVPIPAELGDQGSVLVLAQGDQVRFLYAQDLQVARERSLQIVLEDELNLNLSLAVSRCSLLSLGLSAGEQALSPLQLELVPRLPIRATFEIDLGGDSSLKPVPRDSPTVVRGLASLPWDAQQLCEAASVGARVTNESFELSFPDGLWTQDGVATLPEGRVLSALTSRDPTSAQVREHALFSLRLHESPERLPGWDGVNIVGLGNLAEDLVAVSSGGAVYRGTLTGTTAQYAALGPTLDARILENEDLSSLWILARQPTATLFLRVDADGTIVRYADWPSYVTVRGPVVTEDLAISLATDQALFRLVDEQLEQYPLPENVVPSRLQYLPGQGLILIGSLGEIYRYQDSAWQALPSDPDFRASFLYPLGQGYISVGSLDAYSVRRYSPSMGPCGNDALQIQNSGALHRLSDDQLLWISAIPGRRPIGQTLIEAASVPDPCFDP